MRPVSAFTIKHQNSNSFWRKYENIKPDHSQFRCFKTLTEILQAHNYKPMKQFRKNVYYHKIVSPRIKIKQKQNASSKQLNKSSNNNKRNSTCINRLERNPYINKNINYSSMISLEDNLKGNFIQLNTELLKIQDQKKKQKKLTRKFQPYNSHSTTINNNFISASMQCSVVRKNNILSESHKNNKIINRNCVTSKILKERFSEHLSNDRKVQNNYFINNNHNNITKYFLKNQKDKIIKKKMIQIPKQTYNNSQNINKKAYKNEKFQLQRWDNSEQDLVNISTLLEVIK